jgi:hypothetical protein
MRFSQGPFWITKVQCDHANLQRRHHETSEPTPQGGQELSGVKSAGSEDIQDGILDRTFQ